ncbi:hypothetical protein BC941DRAFT_476806 [Chlamydoabsidia padenii]|nr:hypothetical protein BC941DRAFT_476806 [Chlamydoabsidia padenii]
MPLFYDYCDTYLTKSTLKSSSTTAASISPPPHQLSTITRSTNCLLYTDNVALIGTSTSIQSPLDLCDTHSSQLGYRWNPTKCVILEPDPTIQYQLYDTMIPTLVTFTYLVILISIGGNMDATSLIDHNTKKALISINILTTRGLNGSGYRRLLSSRPYQQFIRLQLEYGLAITATPKKNTKLLDSAQDICFRRIYGAHSRSSTIVMKQFSGIPYMQPLIQQLPSSTVTINTKQTIRQYLRQQLHYHQDSPRFLKHCCDSLKIDPILKVPTQKVVRSRLIRWRLGWLFDGKSQSCRCGYSLNKGQVITCLLLYARLSLDRHLTQDPLSFVLNRLPQSPPTSPLTINDGQDLCRSSSKFSSNLNSCNIHITKKPTTTPTKTHS